MLIDLRRCSSLVEAIDRDYCFGARVLNWGIGLKGTKDEGCYFKLKPIFHGGELTGFVSLGVGYCTWRSPRTHVQLVLRRVKMCILCSLCGLVPQLLSD